MSEEPKQNRSLSEIGHLFLSSIRERQMNGTSRPQRKPPGANGAAEPPAQRVERRIEETAPLVREVSVTAVIAAHLNGNQISHVATYARHLAGHGDRVGLIEVDEHLFRLSFFDQMKEEEMAVADVVEEEEFDARSMGEAIQELNWDVDRWLLVVPELRVIEARELLRNVSRWTALSTCDHDGVVSCYRTLKGLAAECEPRLRLAVVDAESDMQAGRVFQKMASVCQQFLGWTLETAEVVRDVANVEEHLVMCCHVSPGQEGMQWKVIGDFLAKAKTIETELADAGNRAAEKAALIDEPVAEEGEVLAKEPHCDTNFQPAADAIEEEPILQEPASSVSSYTHKQDAHVTEKPAEAVSPVRAEMMEVIELEGEEAAGVMSAVFKKWIGELAECAIRPPMCAGARVAISRDRRLTLIAMTGRELRELSAIGQAYRWLIENRQLIQLALPQFAIDIQSMPRLRLLVDQLDMKEESLQSIMGNENASVVGYRKVKWGDRIGLLLF